MKDEHIKATLDDRPLGPLGDEELASIRSHAASCAECGRAFEAALASSLMLKSRAVETFEPPPFFHARVLAALRERKAGEVWSLGRLWRAAGVLFSTMAATVAALAALTFVVPQQQTATQQDVASAGRTYSAEDVILGQSEQADDQMSYGQVMSTLYSTDENAER